MDIDSFFTSPRWKILEILAKTPSSPLEISKILNTSIAYISQQLKLLEAVGLITKEKTKATEKGQPRTIFSLADEFLYITLLIKNSPAKKLIHLSDYHKTILKIWLLDNPSIHYYIEKFYWKIEDDIRDVNAIMFDGSLAKPKIIVFSNSKKLKQKLEPFCRELKGKLDFSFLLEGELKNFSSEKFTLFYSNDALNKLDNVKGGLNGK